MAHEKLAFDPDERLVRVAADFSDGVFVLNVARDLYSAGKEDWLDDPVLNKMRFPVTAIGGDPIPGGVLGTTYLLTDGWKIDPNLNFVALGGVVDDSSQAIIGPGGDDEELRTDVASLGRDFLINQGRVTIRKVGNPTDAIRFTIEEEDGTPHGSALREAASINSDFLSLFLAFEDVVAIDRDVPIRVAMRRTGPRDEANHYEIAVDTTTDLAAGFFVSDNGVFTSRPGNPVREWNVVVPYTLNVEGNLFADDGSPAVLPTLSVSTNQTVSTLVEVRQPEGDWSPEDRDQALEDLELIRQIEGGRWRIVNNQMIFYAADGVTPLKTFDLLDENGQPTMTQPFERVPQP